MVLGYPTTHRLQRSSSLRETRSGAPTNSKFFRGSSHLDWLGKISIPNDTRSWFDFTMATKRHDSNSETGVDVVDVQPWP